MARLTVGVNGAVGIIVIPEDDAVVLAIQVPPVTERSQVTTSPDSNALVVHVFELLAACNVEETLPRVSVNV